MNNPYLASTLASKRNTGSRYTDNIINAARVLVQQGNGHYVYSTQWATGATLWRNPADEDDTKVIQPTWLKVV